MDWLPIESAPRDGDILVYVPESNEQFVAYWHKRFGAWVYAATESGVRVFTKSATHWQPLPPPPSTPEKAE